MIALSLSVAPWMLKHISTYQRMYETYKNRVAHYYSSVHSRYTWGAVCLSFDNVIVEAHVRIYSILTSCTLCGNERALRGDCTVELNCKTVIACVSSLLFVH